MHRSYYANIRERAFWTCLGVLVVLAAAYGGALVVFLTRDALLDPPMSTTLAWRVAVACWAVALPPIWLIARLESRWIARHVQQPAAPPIETKKDIQFVADAAHELRTPLTAQSLVGENALARKGTSGELREAVGSMLEESKHMRHLIDSLLELTRASATGLGDQDPSREPTPLDLTQLCHNCVESLQILAEERQQQIRLISAGHVWVDADLTMVRQALLNVIHNAIEHCQEGARIQVETLVSVNGEGAIRVVDDGPGIPTAQQARVFERFYRGPGNGREAARRRSLGLGLSIARAMLESQRGNIRLESFPGAGSCFTLTLPLCYFVGNLTGAATFTGQALRTSSNSSPSASMHSPL